jgi:hypothetical protein
MKVRQLAAEAYVYRFNVVFDFKSNQRGHWFSHLRTIIQFFFDIC